MSLTPAQQGCDACNKSVLSLLLLRPSPLPKDSRLAPIGGQGVADAAGLVNGLVPAASLAESRYVLRLLRTGYVHVYVPSPPPGVKNWVSYRVTDGADLIAETNTAFGQQPQPPACRREGHNRAGMKLLPIAQAHKISTLWVAYSANLWSDKLKAQNAANPKAMRQVNLRSCGMHDFRPTAQALSTQVLECALTSLKVPNPVAGEPALAQDPQFPFCSQADNVQSLAAALQRAAACHPQTVGHEMALVLPDPVGVAAELNAIRLRRNQLYEAEIARPANSHPLNSEAAVAGLKQVFLTSKQLNSFDKVSPLCTRAKFESSSWPSGTEWVPLTVEDRAHLERLALGDNFLTYLFLTPVRTVLENKNLGRAIYPDLEDRAAAWAQDQVNKSWAELAPHVDEAAAAQWRKQFAARMKSLHGDPLKRHEDDWLAAAHAASTVHYFCTHFDPQDPNEPGPLPGSGETYASESALIHQPAPFSLDLQEPYLKPLDAPIISDEAVALRALVGNQESVFSLIHTQLSGDPGDTGMRDKTYDFLKGVLQLDAAQPVLAKFSWLGFGVAGFSTGYLSAASGALTNAFMSQATGLSPKMQARLLRVQSLWGVQRLMEVAANGSLKGGAVAMPVLLHMKVDAKRAMEVLRARAGQATGGSRSYIKRVARQGHKISMALLTDTEALRAVNGNTGAALVDPASGKLNIGPTAKQASAGLGTLALTEGQFLSLYAKEAGRGTQAVNALRESLKSGAGLHAKTIALSLPGRLALGSTLVQGLGLINGLYALKQAGNDKEVRDAWYGIYDSAAGTLGGLLELWSVAREATALAVVGEEAAKKSLSIGALRVVGAIAGAAGGVVNAAGGWSKANDAHSQSDFRSSYLYLSSSYAFGGTVITGLASGAGFAANTLVARGVGGVVVETIAARAGASAVLATVGGTALTVSGIGLILLGAGVALQVGAVVLTPTPLQRWLSRSHFGRDPSIFDWDGKRDDMFVKGDWKAEFAAFQEALAVAGKAAPPKPSLVDKAKAVVSP